MQRLGILTRHPFLLVALAISLLAFALACGSSSEPTSIPTTSALATPTSTTTSAPTATPSPTIQRGGQIIQYMGTFPSHFDQTQLCCPSELLSLTKVYLTVLNETGDGKIECDICSDWHLEDGGKTMVFKLRGDATFHDGTTIKAADIKYSLEKLTGQIDGIVNVRSGFIKEYIDSIEAPDDKTVLIKMLRPAPIVPQALTVGMSAILPVGTTRDNLTSAPLGPNNKYTSGPYYIKEAVPDSHIQLERNPNYFKKGADGQALPYLDSIKMQVFANLTAGTTAFTTGNLDLFVWLGAPPYQFWPQLSQMKGAGAISMVEKPLYCSMGEVWLNVDDPLMKDPKVRQAFNLAADRTEYATVRYRDFVAALLLPADTTWGRASNEIWNVIPGWGTDAKKVAEQEQAKQILADAGYPNGVDMKMMAYSTAFDTGGSEALQRNLQSVGIRAELDHAADYSQRWAKSDFTAFNYRTCLAIGDPDEVYAGYFVTGGARNFENYRNPQMDSLYVQMSSEQDPIKRKELVRQMEDMVLTDLPNITLPDGIYRWYFNSKLQGFTADTTSANIYRVATNRGEGWWLEK